MSTSQTLDNKDKKLMKLVKQVDELSKVVDKLQEEVNAIKSKKRPNENSQQNATNDRLKSFRRLRFFQRNDETDNSKVDDISSINEDNNHDPAIDKHHSKHRKSEKPNQNYNADNVVEFKAHSTQTQVIPIAEKMDVSTVIWSVRDCCVQTEANYRKCPGKLTDSEKIVEEFSCKNCKKNCKKKEKLKKKQSKSRCAQDCPYLDESNSIKSCDSQTACENHRKNSKKCKNKKIMVKLDENKKDEVSNNSEAKCEPQNDITYGNIREIRPLDPTTKICLTDCTKKVKTSKKNCKNCSNKCGIKNVLKIRKAILTNDPPIILMSPKEQKGTCK